MLFLRHFDPKLCRHNAFVLCSGLDFYNYLPLHTRINNTSQQNLDTLHLWKLGGQQTTHQISLKFLGIICLAMNNYFK